MAEGYQWRTITAARMGGHLFLASGADDPVEVTNPAASAINLRRPLWLSSNRFT